jgi:hypothetical protein
MSTESERQSRPVRAQPARWAAAAAFVLLLAGCGSSLESFGEGGKILGWMKVSSGKLKALQASAALLQTSPRGTFRGDAYIFFKAPESLRIDVLGPVSNMVGVFVSREGEGLVLDYLNGKALSSPDGSCLFSQFLGTRMVLPDLPSIFMGKPPVIQFDGSDLRETSKGYYILNLRSKGAGVVEKLQLVQGLYGTVVIRAVVLKDKKKVVDISFRKRGWNKEATPLMPRVIEVGFVPEQMRMLFKYRSVEVDKKIDDDIFNVKIPEGFSVEEVRCE